MVGRAPLGRRASEAWSARARSRRSIAEYERTVTTVADAYLRRPCAAYLVALASVAARGPGHDLRGRPDPPCRGGRSAGRRCCCPDRPAGCWPQPAAARLAGFSDCVTFDMGGTSTDVCLIRDGRPEPAAQRRVAGYPIRMPALDVHTIGGRRWFDRPDRCRGCTRRRAAERRGRPGPACYGRGGHAPTVTDADLAAGRIPRRGSGGPGSPRRGRRPGRARPGRGHAPTGSIAVVDEAMVQAIRAVSVQRGVDPAGLALVAFGGAGPLHACALAEALGMPAVVVPPRAGVLSAVGILGAPRQVDLVRSWGFPCRSPGRDEPLWRRRWPSAAGRGARRGPDRADGRGLPVRGPEP